MKKARILVVEDETIVAADLEARLVNLGYDVLASVQRGEQALPVARRWLPDVVLMDIHLGGEMDGVEAAHEIRHELHLPVIFLTAHSDRGTLNRAKLTEPFGYVLKPFEERELESTIEMALYRHQVECNLRESEARYHALWEANFDAIVLHENGIFLEVNPSFETLFGYSRDEVIGQHGFDVIAEPQSFDIIGERISTRSEVPYEAVFHCKNGKRFTANLRPRNLFYQGRHARAVTIRPVEKSD